MTTEQLYNIGLISESCKLQMQHILNLLQPDPEEYEVKCAAMETIINLIQAERFDAAAATIKYMNQKS